jgi:hypothetical protein
VSVSSATDACIVANLNITFNSLRFAQLKRINHDIATIVASLDSEHSYNLFTRSHPSEEKNRTKKSQQKLQV